MTIDEFTLTVDRYIQQKAERIFQSYGTVGRGRMNGA